MDSDDPDAAGPTLDGLEQSLGGVGAMARVFDEELKRMQVTLVEAGASTGTLSTSLSGGLRRAFDGLVFDGRRLSDALRSVTATIAGATYSAAMKPITRELGGMLASGLASIGAAGFARGGVFSGGAEAPGAGGVGGIGQRVRPFARGGVVSEATSFPMRGGMGLMGEAGPEAIMPLSRGPDGSLGVRASGGGGRPVQVVMHVTTPDVAGFERSQSQIAARLGRVLARGERNR